MPHYQIAHQRLTLEQLAERIGKHLPPQLSTVVARPWTGFNHRVLVYGDGMIGTGIRLRQGPRASVLSIGRELVTMPAWCRYMPRFVRNLVSTTMLMIAGHSNLAVVRSILLDSGEFTGPNGGPPQRTGGQKMWLVARPGLFTSLALLKLIVGLVLVCGSLFILIVEPPVEGIEIQILAGTLGGRWLYIGIANLMGRIPSFTFSLVPLAVSLVVFAVAGYSARPLHRYFKNREDDAAWQKVVDGGPIEDYLKTVNGFTEGPAEEKKILEMEVQRGVYLIATRNRIRYLSDRNLPWLPEAQRTTDDRMKQIDDLADRKMAEGSQADTLAAMFRGAKVTASDTPPDGVPQGKLCISVDPENPVVVEEIENYLRARGMSVMDRRQFSVHAGALVDASDMPRAKELLGLEKPKVDPAAIPVADLDREKDLKVHTDDPESPYVIVPAQFARSLYAALNMHSPDLKWDEARQRQGKLVMQVWIYSGEKPDEIQKILDAWQPQADYVPANYSSWERPTRP